MKLYSNLNEIDLAVVAAHLRWPGTATAHPLSDATAHTDDATAAIVVELTHRTPFEAALTRHVSPVLDMIHSGRTALVFAALSSSSPSGHALCSWIHATLDTLGIAGSEVTIATGDLTLPLWYDWQFAGRDDRIRFRVVDVLAAARAPDLVTDRPDRRMAMCGSLSTVHGVSLAAFLMRDGLLAGTDYGTSGPMHVGESIRTAVGKHKYRPHSMLPELIDTLETRIAGRPERARSPVPTDSLPVIVDDTCRYAGAMRLPQLVATAIEKRLPFLICGEAHALRMMRRFGFRTFEPFIDEAYDDVLEPNIRLEILHAEILRLHALSDDGFVSLLENLSGVLDHNAAHLEHLRTSAEAVAAVADDADRWVAEFRPTILDTRFSVPNRLVPAWARSAVPAPAARSLDASAVRSRERIGIVSHLASSGGTVISKCIATKSGVSLLSEIHPFSSIAVAAFNPLYQYKRWFGLSETLTEEVRALAEAGGATFTDIVECLAHDATRRGTTLVLRDWAYVDYVRGGGLPPWARPSLVEALAPRMDVDLLVTTRHPLDTWLSLVSSRFVHPAAMAEGMRGMRIFAEDAASAGYMKYEAFTEAPGPWLREAADRLGVPFDPAWENTWSEYKNITGDSGRRSETISPRPRRTADPETMAALDANPDYHRICELLGYT